MCTTKMAAWLLACTQPLIGRSALERIFCLFPPQASLRQLKELSLLLKSTVKCTGLTCGRVRLLVRTFLFEGKSLSTRRSSSGLLMRSEKERHSDRRIESRQARGKDKWVIQDFRQLVLIRAGAELESRLCTRSRSTARRPHCSFNAILPADYALSVAIKPMVHGTQKHLAHSTHCSRKKTYRRCQKKAISSQPVRPDKAVDGRQKNKSVLTRGNNMGTVWGGNHPK
jgi:hypothetical protein